MRRVEIGAKDESNLELEFQELRDIQGHVSFAAGCPAVQLRVMANDLESLAPAGVSSAAAPDGAFLLTGLSPGHLRISAASDGRWLALTSVRLGEHDVREAGFDYPVAGSDALRIQVSCNGGRQP